MAAGGGRRRAVGGGRRAAGGGGSGGDDDTIHRSSGGRRWDLCPSRLPQRVCLPSTVSPPPLCANEPSDPRLTQTQRVCVHRQRDTLTKTGPIAATRGTVYQRWSDTARRRKSHDTLPGPARTASHPVRPGPSYPSSVPAHRPASTQPTPARRGPPHRRQ